MEIATSSTTSGTQPSSKFKGVVRLRCGKWGSQISFKSRPNWLGSYDLEEEAARAFDRAAIKLQRSDTPLNYPVSVYTPQEMRFQGQYSNEEILKMLKDKTYVPKFSEFLADQSLVTGFIMNRSNRDEGISYVLLFQKELTETDVTDFKGFHIPREYAMQNFPSLETGEGQKRSMELTFYDKHCRSWTFLYSFRKRTETFVFSKGWGHFVRMNGLKPKDYIFFYGCDYRREDEGNRTFVIDVQKAGTDIMNHVSNGVEVEEMEEEETGTDVMLFGVLIGKRKRTDE